MKGKQKAEIAAGACSRSLPMGPRRTRPETIASPRRRVTAIASPSSVKKTPSKKRAVTPRTRGDTQHDAAVAIASLDVDRGLRERIDSVARRVQRGMGGLNDTSNHTANQRSIGDLTVETLFYPPVKNETRMTR